MTALRLAVMTSPWHPRIHEGDSNRRIRSSRPVLATESGPTAGNKAARQQRPNDRHEAAGSEWHDELSFLRLTAHSPYPNPVHNQRVGCNRLKNEWFDLIMGVFESFKVSAKRWQERYWNVTWLSTMTLLCLLNLNSARFSWSNSIQFPSEKLVQLTEQKNWGQSAVRLTQGNNKPLPSSKRHVLITHSTL